MSDWHVLVVEDDPDGQEVVARILKHHRISVDLAADGENAVELLAQNTYTVIIIDLALPHMNGWELLNIVKSQPATAKTPCIAITAFHSAEVAVKALQMGFSAYFPKPLDATSFVREIENVITP